MGLTTQTVYTFISTALKGAFKFITEGDTYHLGIFCINIEINDKNGTQFPSFFVITI